MNYLPQLSKIYEPIVESGYLPDMVTRVGIKTLLAKRIRSLRQPSGVLLDEKKKNYILSLKEREKIAIHTEEANEQHYEVPTRFFELCLGKRLKYSCCLYENGAKTLDEAEIAMLELYCQRAQIEDGMSILDLGCGWGSLTLFLAQKYPNSSVTGLSNSSTQRESILEKAALLGLSNVTILTRDINTANLDQTFDRILSIEMFEHMKNYSKLLEKVSSWLVPQTGRLFVHIFAHKEMPYDFKTDEDNSWMAKYFFTGGTMPSADLFMWFQEHLTVLDRWTVNGVNYGKTSEDWLINMDKNRKEILEIFKKCYGAGNEEIWFQRWRIFYLAVAETFAYDNGEEWPVVHYLFSRK